MTSPTRAKNFRRPRCAAMGNFRSNVSAVKPRPLRATGLGIARAQRTNEFELPQAVDLRRREPSCTVRQHRADRLTVRGNGRGLLRRIRCVDDIELGLDASAAHVVEGNQDQ